MQNFGARRRRIPQQPVSENRQAVMLQMLGFVLNQQDLSINEPELERPPAAVGSSSTNMRTGHAAHISLSYDLP